MAYVRTQPVLPLIMTLSFLWFSSSLKVLQWFGCSLIL